MKSIEELTDWEICICLICHLEHSWSMGGKNARRSKGSQILDPVLGLIDIPSDISWSTFNGDDLEKEASDRSSVLKKLPKKNLDSENLEELDSLELCYHILIKLQFWFQGVVEISDFPRMAWDNDWSIFRDKRHVDVICSLFDPHGRYSEISSMFETADLVERAEDIAREESQIEWQEMMAREALEMSNGDFTLSE